jgi:hypothetical protein
MSMRDDWNATMKYWQIEPLIKDGTALVCSSVKCFLMNLATNNDTRSPTLDQLREILNITYEYVSSILMLCPARYLPRAYSLLARLDALGLWKR